MNKDFRVYLGCYVHIPKQEEKVTRTIPGCPKCEQFLSSKFCPRCGSPKGTFVRTDTREKIHDAQKILKESEADSMFIIALNHSLTTIILIPQEDLFHGCGRFIDHETHVPLAFLSDPKISNIVVQQEEDYFMKTFSHSLECIQHIVPNTLMEWGIVAFNDENY